MADSDEGRRREDHRQGLGGGEMRRLLTIALSGLIPLLPVIASADIYFNSSEPGCNGSDPNVLWCDDFERGYWAKTMADPNVTNAGWNMTPFPPAGSWHDSAGTNFGRCGGQGVAGTNCAVTSGFHPNAIGQAPAMGDHSFNGTQSVDDIYMRHYRKFLPGFQFGAEKIWTVNPCCAGIGGIKFANNSLGAVASVGSQASPVTTVAAEDANRSWNYTVTSGNWYYIEEHIKLNTPGVANGVLEIWADNCGANGLGCTGTPTLRVQYTNVMWRLAGDNTQIGSIWLENWSNIPSIGEEYYDQIKVSKVGPIGFMPMGTPPSDIVAPTVSMTAPTSGATVSGSAVTVSANASDSVGVVGVQFKLDGANLGTEDTSSPYSISWNTTTASEGGHTLTAVASDARVRHRRA